ncbi:phage GP46 family protein [Brevundimonas vitis]|uniref:Phage GP46 family protein n=1 Tax=Brevundimonas vitisensis TaxID=2800818 RepID=A0ABX7BU86_9CAUL|nr:phage GP46 family protein [Brevundimonas vitisensis]QQQ19664.1 phage GP46 family protein [Brevundimonas vitisensis]
MTDLALIWDAVLGTADLGIEAGALVTDEGLRTAVMVSLFTDRRARADDVLPDQDGDRRGWWGDVAAPVANDRIGSRLWLLERSKRLDSVLSQARDYCDEALAWMIEDGVARTVTVTVEVDAQGQTLAIGVVITRPDGSQSRFDTAWSAT